MPQIVLSASERPYYDRFCVIADELDLPLNHSHVAKLARAANRIAKAAAAPKSDPSPPVPKGVAARSAARKALEAPESQLPPAAPAEAAPAVSVAAKQPRPPLTLEERLSDVDRQVLAMVVQGVPNPAIGVRLGLSSDQAKAKVRRLRKLLGVETREAIPRAAVRAGILDAVTLAVAEGAGRPSAASQWAARGAGGRFSSPARTEPPETAGASGVPVTAPGGPSAPPSIAPGSTETSTRPTAPQAATQAVRA